MTGSERTTISASMSGAPSLVNSLNSYSSSTKLNGSKTILSPEPEISFVDNFLEKAKFYTSLCLGNFQFNVLKNHLVLDIISFFTFI